MGSFQWAISVAVLPIIAAWAHAQSIGAAPEYQVKAAFLYNVVKFIEWPEDTFSGAAAPIAICVLGDDPFEEHLERILKGQRVNGRPLTVQRLGRVPDAQACHVLFVSASEKKRLPEIFELLADRGVLTVGDVRGFRDGGGMIGLTTEENRLSFDVDLAAANRAHVKISSQLLRLARSVTGTGTN